LYYQKPPFSTNEVFLGSKGGVSQLVDHGPSGVRQGYAEKKAHGKKYTNTELNKAAKWMYRKGLVSSPNYDDLTIASKEKKKVYDAIDAQHKITGEGKFKVKTQSKPFSETDQAKILKVYPNAKFEPGRVYGFAPDDPLYKEVWRFVDKGFKKTAIKRLPKYLQKELETNFPWVEFNWEGKSRYGVPTNLWRTDPNLYKKIQTYLDDPKPWRYGFDLRTPEGWMSAQIDRGAVQGNPQYESKTIKVTVADKDGNKKIIDQVIGVKDGNKTYFTNDVLLKKHGEKGDLLINKHPDFENTKKYWSVADKYSKKFLSEYDNLAKLLPEGFDPKKIQLNDLLQFIGDKDGVKGLNRAKRAIEIHHEYDVRTRATKKYQLLRQDLNALGNTITRKIKSETLGAAEEALAKNIRLNIEGQRYGPRKVSPTQDIKTIVSQAETEMKGFKKKDWKTFKTLLNSFCPKKAQGGRVGFDPGGKVGGCPPEVALKNMKDQSGALKLFQQTGEGLTKEEAARISARLITAAKGIGVIPRAMKFLFGPAMLWGEPLFEGAFIGYKVLGKGVPLKEAWAESYWSYMDPRKYTGELEDLPEKALYEVRDEKGNLMYEKSGPAGQVEARTRPQVKRYIDNNKKLEKLNTLKKLVSTAHIAGRGPVGQRDLGARADRVAEAEKRYRDYLEVLGGDEGVRKLQIQISEDKEAYDNRVAGLEAERQESALFNWAHPSKLGPSEARIEQLRKKKMEEYEAQGPSLETATDVAKYFTPGVIDYLSFKGDLPENATFDDLLNLYPKAPPSIKYSDKYKRQILASERRINPELNPWIIKQSFKDDPAMWGTQERFAGGGLANLTRTVAPDSGPVSRGLRSLYIDDMD